MHSLVTFFALPFISYVTLLSTLTIQTVIESSLSNLFTNHTFVEDDICSSVIIDHPCVKNILTVLVNHISYNVREIRSCKEKSLEIFEILAKQIMKNQEIIMKNQEVVKANQNEIKLLKTELKQLKMKTYLESNSTQRDTNFNDKNNWLHTTNKAKENFHNHIGDGIRHIIENSKPVSFSFWICKLNSHNLRAH